MASRRVDVQQTPVKFAAPIPEDAPMKKRNDLNADDLFDADATHEVAAEEEVPTGGGGSDDALGLYLKQMGAIPLLNREKELSLAIRLENARKRYRRAVLFCWWSQQRIVGMFELIHAGKMPIDPQIDVVHSLGLDRDRITARLPHNLRTLRQLIRAGEKSFRLELRTRSTSGRTKLQRQRWRQLRKAIRLVEELSPRTELLDAMAEEFDRSYQHVRELSSQAVRPGRSALLREERRRAVKELRNKTREVVIAPDDMHRLLKVIRRRQAKYQHLRSDGPRHRGATPTGSSGRGPHGARSVRRTRPGVEQTGNGAFASAAGCYDVRFHGDASSGSTKRPATIAIGSGTEGR
jgi:RNA polymerase primary sigma factor